MMRLKPLNNFQNDRLVNSNFPSHFVDSLYCFLVCCAFSQPHDITSRSINKFVICWLYVSHNVWWISIEAAHYQCWSCIQQQFYYCVMRKDESWWKLRKSQFKMSLFFVLGRYNKGRWNSDGLWTRFMHSKTKDDFIGDFILILSPILWVQSSNLSICEHFLPIFLNSLIPI